MKRPKFKYRILAIIIVLLVLGIPFLLFTKSSIKDKIRAEVEHFNNTSPIKISYDKLDLSFISGNSTIENITLIRDSVSFENQNLSSTRPNISIGKLKLRGLSALALAFSKKVDLNKVVIEDFKMTYVEKEINQANIEQSETKVDSIRIKGLSGFSLGVLEFNTYDITVLSKESDTITYWAGDTFEIDGIELKNNSSDSDYFTFNKDNLRLTSKEQLIQLNQEHYTASVGQLEMTFNDGKITINDLKMYPTDGAEALSKIQEYSNDITSVEIGQLQTFGFDVNSLIASQNIIVDSIAINNADIDILKNKHKPTDKARRPLLMHQKLRRSKSIINIGRIGLRNSTFDYVEMNPNKKNTEVDLTNVSIDISNMNNSKLNDSGNKMTISIFGTAFKAVDFETTLTFPDILTTNTFYFEGAIGSSQFESFNTVMLPTTGIKFEKGNLNGIKFKATANTTHSEGELTMLFDNLETTVLKKDNLEEHKTFSFLANTAVKKQNPSKNGDLSIAKMQFDRTLYKGMGNYLFKTLESGLINSVYPFGNRKKIKKK